MIPDRPPMMKKTMKPTMNSSGALKIGRAGDDRRVQANIWIADGITMIRLAAAK